jgi:adenosylcobinamide-GDP ribazoletransferase
MFDRLLEEVRTFAHALTFYTRIPLNLSGSYSEQRLGRCSMYLPILGWLVGGVGALVFRGAQALFPDSMAIAFSMIATILLTGALHEDGLADFCDGFGGGWAKERILEIMKDSRLGTYGVIGLISILGLKWLSLSALDPDRIGLILIAAHSLSRLVAISFPLTLPYVGLSDASKSSALGAPLSKSAFAFAVLTGLAPLFFFRDFRLFLCLIPLALLRWLLGVYLKKKIGGFTGDCLGAAQQLAELAFYLCILASAWTST